MGNNISDTADDPFTGASVYEKITPEPSGVRFWYQRNRKFQRLILLIPANATEWIDTHLQSQILGTRPLYANWRSKIRHDPSLETEEQFVKRISEIQLRFVPDLSRVEQRRTYVARGIDSPSVLLPMMEVLLRTDTVTTLRFPSEPGIIQVQLAKSRPADIGNTRIELLALAVDNQDWFVFENSISGRIDVLDVSTDNFHPLPPMPEV